MTDLSKVTQEERAKVDMCECGHSRAEHHGSPMVGGPCSKCRPSGYPVCTRFTWSHFDEKYAAA